MSQDRFSDARIALGSEAFDPFILESIVAVLSPYRRRAHQMVKLSLYLSATSLLSKSPLPHDAVGIEEHLQDFIEDAVIISAKIADTEQGAVAVKEGMCIICSCSPFRIPYYTPHSFSCRMLTAFVTA